MNYFVPLVFIFSILIISFLPSKNKETDFDAKLIQKSKAVINNIDSKLTTNSFQSGKIYSLNDMTTISEQQINNVINKKTNGYSQKSARLYTWYDYKKNVISLSALGLDWKHHFANSFLVGIRPFPVKNKWLPLYTIAKLKTYEYDHKQYNAKEMWQNSAQAFKYPRGDCEDHALILADWLISEGVDARVVGGKYKNIGHAWVVAIINNKEYILEATSKRASNNWNSYPLAKLAINYHAQYMFNRTDFWIKKTSAPNYSYKDNHWHKSSFFKNDIQPLSKTTKS